MSDVYWRSIKEYEGHYECSTDGRVRSMDRVVDSGRGGGRNQPGRILKPRAVGIGVGYLAVNLCKDGKMKTKAVHRLIAESFLIRGENESQVNHKNGIKTDNHVSNLHWCNGSENMIHANENGWGRGKRLNSEEVADITKRFAGGGITKIRLGIEYDVSSATIARIINHPERFKPIPEPPTTRHVVMIADIADKGVAHEV